jgi:hypothetical protein
VIQVIAFDDAFAIPIARTQSTECYSRQVAPLFCHCPMRILLLLKMARISYREKYRILAQELPLRAVIIPRVVICELCLSVILLPDEFSDFPRIRPEGIVDPDATVEEILGIHYDC